MKSSKRIAALFLSVCMMMSSVGIQAQAQTENTLQAKPIELEDETERELLGGEERKQMESVGGGTELEEEISEEEKESDGEKNSEKDSELKSETFQETREALTETKEPEIIQEEGVLNYVMQESTYIETPGQQNVVASLGADKSTVESAQLQYRNVAANQELTVDAAKIAGNMARFTMEYNSEAQSGIYELKSITWQTAGKSYIVQLDKSGMEVTYGVNREVEAEPDDMLIDEKLLEEVEANVVTMDGNGNTISENSVENVLEQAQTAGNIIPREAVKRGSKSMVIVLDPGHDSTHAGARKNGCIEEDLVLKIALYCKAELQKYNLINVYMTRETKACPYGASGITSSTCNASRVEFAKKKGADVYVSFHLNSSVSSTPQGVGVYYPNGNYRPNIGAEGKGLASDIYKKLAALGLSTWAGGILIHNSENNTLYPDGSLADYLAVIRRSKEAGFPAVLIEHAFLSNINDVNNFLNSDAKLKKLGIADAQGIAEYYDLSLKGKQAEISSIQSRNSTKLRISWSAVTGAVSYQVYRSDSENGDYTLVGEVAGNTYEDDGLTPGKTYYYKIRTAYGDGNKSDFSQPYSGKTLVTPGIISAVSKSGGKINLSWNTVAGAAQYEITRREAGKDGYSKIATVKAGQTSYLDSNVKTQKTYYYKVRARGGEKNGYSNYSKAYSGWAVKKTKISSVRSRTSTSLQIKWNKVENAYAYRIQRSTSKKGKYTTVATVKSAKSTSYEDKKLKTGKNYYYRIEVLNRVGGKNGYSGYCSPVSGSTVKGTSIVYVKSQRSNGMEIKWKKDSKAYSYKIKRSTSKNGNYKTIAEIKKAATVKYVDKKISSGKKYYYVVETVIKKNGVKQYSGNSKAVSATNIAKIPVQSLQAEQKGIKLTWKKTAGTSSYQIVRSEEERGTYKEIAKLGSETTSYTDTSVKAGQRYYYKIRGVKDGKYTGYGTYSEPLEKWAIAAPAGLKVSQSKPNQMKLSWKEVKGASEYEILRSVNKNRSYKVIAKVSGQKTVSYLDKSVQPEVTYYYKVAARGKQKSAAGRGEESNIVSGKTSIEKSEITAITENAQKFLEIQVKEIQGAFGYELQRSLQPEQGFETIGTIDTKTKSFTDKDVVEGSTYHYRVRTIWKIEDTEYYSGYSSVKEKAVGTAAQ